MKVSFGGIGESVATFYNNASSGAAPGGVAKISANGEVAACANGNAFCGVCVSSDDNFAAVQISGFVTLPYAGTAPARGYVKLSAAGSREVKADASAGREYLVIEVDTVAKTVGFIL